MVLKKYQNMTKKTSNFASSVQFSPRNIHVKSLSTHSVPPPLSDFRTFLRLCCANQTMLACSCLKAAMICHFYSRTWEQKRLDPKVHQRYDTRAEKFTTKSYLPNTQHAIKATQKGCAINFTILCDSKQNRCLPIENNGANFSLY